MGSVQEKADRCWSLISLKSPADPASLGEPAPPPTIWTFPHFSALSETFGAHKCRQPQPPPSDWQRSPLRSAPLFINLAMVLDCIPGTRLSLSLSLSPSLPLSMSDVSPTGALRVQPPRAADVPPRVLMNFAPHVPPLQHHYLWFLLMQFFYSNLYISFILISPSGLLWAVRRWIWVGFKLGWVGRCCRLFKGPGASDVSFGIFWSRQQAVYTDFPSSLNLSSAPHLHINNHIPAIAADSLHIWCDRCVYQADSSSTPWRAPLWDKGVKKVTWFLHQRSNKYINPSSLWDKKSGETLRRMGIDSNSDRSHQICLLLTSLVLIRANLHFITETDLWFARVKSWKGEEIFANKSILRYCDCPAGD